MARIFTTPEAEKTAKAFMHDIVLAAGLIPKSQRTRYSNNNFDVSFISAAKEICDEIVNRNFADIDRSIQEVSYSRFRSTLDGGVWKRFKPDGAAKAIVYFAELNNLYWDDTIRTPYEIDEFKKTLLGATVYKYGRYISAIKSKGTKKTSSSAGSGTGQSAPQNGYKASGPQSGNVRDLQGQPGAKVTADTDLIYKIIADKVGKNTPNVFIKPLSSSGATGNTNKIFISSGNGYTDCTCYFDDPNDAQAFLNKIIQNNRVPANINNLRVVKMKADPNGYFLVGTEFGIVAVSAKTLNEALTEAAKTKEDDSYSWEKATQHYTKEQLDNLHACMRRG